MARAGGSRVNRFRLGMVIAGGVLLCVGLGLGLPLLLSQPGPVPSVAPPGSIRPDGSGDEPVPVAAPEARPALEMHPFPPVTSVPIRPADEAQGGVGPSETVLGIVLGGQARAYPINMLSDPAREILNDELGGRPIAVTWCDRCQSAVVFDRVVDERPLTLFVTGKLIDDNMVMEDVETGTRWLQLEGRALEGGLAGRSLALISSVVTDWDTWRRGHPESSVLDLPRVSQAYRHHERYAEFAGEREFFDRHLIAVKREGDVRAWPFPELRAAMVVNDRVGSLPVLVTFDARTSTARVFQRTVDGHERTFALEAGALRDEETGGRWDPITGTALEGPDAGRRLEPVPATVALRDAWMRHLPGTRLAAPTRLVPASALTGRPKESTPATNATPGDGR